jgi:hypothetical protein
LNKIIFIIKKLNVGQKTTYERIQETMVFREKEENYT